MAVAGIQRAFFALVALSVAGCILARPAPAHVGELPVDLPGERVSIASASGSTLAAWLVRGAPGCGAVLLLHGVGENRLAMLPRMRFLHRAGYTVLAPDLQAHGESPGEHITFGDRERYDARAALGALRAASPGERVGAIAISMGGAALLADAESTHVDAAVLESVYPTIDLAVEHRFAAWLGPFGDLGPLVARLTLALASPRLAIDRRALRPIDRIGRLDAPTLIIAGTEDRYTRASESRALAARARPGTELWMIDGAGHEDLHAYDPRRYESRVGAFLAARLRTEACTAR